MDLASIGIILSIINSLTSIVKHIIDIYKAIKTNK